MKQWNRRFAIAMAVVMAFSIMISGMTVSAFAETEGNAGEAHTLIRVDTTPVGLDQLPVRNANLGHYGEDYGIGGEYITGDGTVPYYELQEGAGITVTPLQEGVAYMVQIRDYPKDTRYGTYYLSRYPAVPGDYSSLTKEGTLVFGKYVDDMDQISLKEEMTFGLPLKLPLKEYNNYDEVLYQVTITAVKGEWWENDVERDSWEFYCKVIEKDPAKRFTDVPANAWYFQDVNIACRLGLIDGRTSTSFVPNDNLTYAEAVKLAACMNQQYTEGTVTLENGTGHWYDSYVDYAKEKGIIDKDYDWNAPATRAGYVEIFAKALPEEAFAVKNEIADGAVPDVAADHAQAEAIYKLYRAGILNGNDDKGTFKPDNSIRRCEVAAIVTRMMDPDSRVDVTL